MFRLSLVGNRLYPKVDFYCASTPNCLQIPFSAMLPSTLNFPIQLRLPQLIASPHNINPQGLPLRIPPPPSFPIIPKSFSTPMHHNTVTAFCPTTCHQYCTNHYLSFQDKTISCPPQFIPNHHPRSHTSQHTNTRSIR